MEARYLTDLEWRICHAVNIYVYRNGRDGEQPILVHIPPSKKKNMRTVMNVVQDRVKYPVGYAKFLYKMDGTRIKDPCELEMYNNYVVASNFEKHFKCAAYGRKRSPLLVLNRESKHVRVLKLQNQNYYEWLLKKKTVGEERPPYIYPAIYSNENYGPQDLPLGQMGNYHPPNMEAPGCCYPRVDGGNKTYRVDGQNKYVVNTVTVDVTPDLTAMRELPRDRRNHRNGNKRPGPGQSKHRGKFMEQTPSDMLNANIATADSVSNDGVSVGTSETEERMKVAKKVRASKHKKTKSHRVHIRCESEEYHEQQCVNVIESTSTPSQTSEDARKLQKSIRKAKRDKERLKFTEPSLPPPPPAQFRDCADYNNNAQQVIPQHPDAQCYKAEILKYVDRAIHNSNANAAPGQKTFYYSPEKLAEINSCGNIQQFELAFSQPQQGGNPAGQWTLVQQPQQQMFQQVYAIESQPQPAAFPIQALDASSINTQRPQPQPPLGDVIASYPLAPQNPPMLQNIQIPQTFQNVQNVPVMQAISSQPVFHQPSPQPTQCMVIPNNTNNVAPTHQQVQSQIAANVNVAPPPQLVTVQNPNSQSQLQQVYQLGIIQQPNPQTCIQVDAKAMRQYMDNQKLMENWYPPTNPFAAQNEQPHQGPRGHRPEKIKSSRYQQKHQTDQTESELDIPFTPLKTYRLNNNPCSSRQVQNQIANNNYNMNQNDDIYDRCGHPCRQKNERLPVKVKSRNVAIQMGYPGASARSTRGGNYIDTHVGSTTDIPYAQDRRNLIFNPRDYSNLSLMERTPMSGRGLYERFLTPSKDRTLRRGNNFGSSYSDQYINLQTSRNHRYPVSVNSVIRSEKPVDKTSEPNLDELVTIPPPNEFRELEAVHFSRHNNPRHQSNSNILFSRRNNAYYCTNNERSESTSQYMHSHYP